MKSFNKIFLGVATLMLAASCTRYDPADFMVDKPESVVAQEDIDSYPALKTFINRANHPKFRLGAAVGLGEYVGKSVM